MLKEKAKDRIVRWAKWYPQEQIFFGKQWKEERKEELFPSFGDALQLSNSKTPGKRKGKKR